MNVPAPPRKREGALQDAPTPPTILAQLNCGSAIGQHLYDPTPLVCSAQDHCEHTDTRIAIEPPGSVHFAREVCCNCDRVLRFVPKPQTVERRRFNALRLVKLAMHSGLSDWEQNFLRDISQRKKVSPRQQALLDRLCRQYLERKS
jgi:hypothetical protein